jgi:hypothetical protein
MVGESALRTTDSLFSKAYCDITYSYRPYRLEFSTGEATTILIAEGRKTLRNYKVRI